MRNAFVRNAFFLPLTFDPSSAPYYNFSSFSHSESKYLLSVEREIATRSLSIDSDRRYYAMDVTQLHCYIIWFVSVVTNEVSFTPYGLLSFSYSIPKNFSTFHDAAAPNQRNFL